MNHDVRRPTPERRPLRPGSIQTTGTDATGPSLTPDARSILRLQHTAGNQAVQRLLQGAVATTAETRRQIGIRPVKVQRQPKAAPPVVDPTPQPSALWYEVSDAHHKLFSEIGLINLRVNSLTRSDWVSGLSTAWAEVGEGNKSDAQLRRYRDDLTKLRAEIAEEVAQARESWQADIGAYQQERQTLSGETKAWTKDALKILDGEFAGATRAVQITGAYLTFDDLVPLERMLSDHKHREHAQTRWARANDGPEAGTSLATGAGLGAIVTYQGKTLVRLGGEKFYVSGVPPKGTWTPKGGTTSVFFVYKQSQPKKMYRLDWDTIKMGPKQGQLGWEHNHNKVAKVLSLTTSNHQPAGGWARAAGTALRIYKWGGRALFVASAVASAVEIYYAENKGRAIAKTGGALAGGLGGAKAGAFAGGRLGARFGVAGAGVGALLGGLLGGAIGAWGGSKATEFVYDLIVDRLEEEDDWVVLTPDQVEPARDAGRSAGD